MGLFERGGEVQATVIPDTSKETIHTEVLNRVEPQSALYTNTMPSYEGLMPYYHDTVNHAIEYVWEQVHTNGIENFWSLFKRCIKGT